MEGKKILALFKLCVPVSLCFLLLFPGNSLSQEEREFVLEDIVVTSERRETLQQETPVAAAVFTGTTVDRLKIEHLENVTSLFPGLVYEGINRAQSRFQLRGQITTDDSAGTDQSFGYFIDGIYMGRSFMLNQTLPDIERIELLRGPQGTLWGHNIVTGSLNVTTKDPTEKFESEMTIDIGSYDMMNYSGLAGGPLIEDKLLGQISFSSRNQDGWLYNVGTGNNVLWTDTQVVSGKLKYFPTEKVDVEFGIIYENGNSSGSGGVVFPGSSPSPFYTIPGPEETHGFSDGSFDQEYLLSRLEINWELDNGWTFSSLTGFIDFSGTQNDVSFFPIPEYLGGVRLDSIQDDSQFTQEIRLMNDPSSRLIWQAGVYYYKAEDTKIEDYLEWPSDPQYFTFHHLITGGQSHAQYMQQDAESESYAIFAQGTYGLTDWLNFTAGARYTWVEKSSHMNNWGTHPVFIDEEYHPGYETDHSTSWDEITPKFTLDALYKDVGMFDSVLLYGTYSKGWKAGGYNPGTSPIEAMTPFKPESVNSYEVGIKTQLLDNRANFNLTGFRAEYTDMQTMTLVHELGTAYMITENASATTNGLEIDALVWVTEWMFLNFGYAYYDATYDEGSILQGKDVGGKRTISTPEHSFNIGWDMQWPVTDSGTLTFSGNYAYHDEVYAQASNDLLILVPGALEYTKMKELTARLSFRSGHWEVSLWGRNLLDELMFHGGGDTISLFIYGPPFPGPWGPPDDGVGISSLRNLPRMYGATIKLRW